jgi:hypothetical protein
LKELAVYRGLGVLMLVGVLAGAGAGCSGGAGVSAGGPARSGRSTTVVTTESKAPPGPAASSTSVPSAGGEPGVDGSATTTVPGQDDWLVYAYAESLAGDRVDLVGCVAAGLSARWPDLADRYLDGSWPDDSARLEMAQIVDGCKKGQPAGPVISESTARAIVVGALQIDGGPTDEATVDCVMSGLRRETPGLLEGLRDPDTLTAAERARAGAVFGKCTKHEQP